ncbi:hypothetical protein GCM10020367_46010 [Streptomyces sannanensis]|uniref:Uncharacterized protein n=1 Tax=Streptomyces sannanensis TaxID=285536 RepID=A0ABP6SGF8_9ACTN
MNEYQLRSLHHADLIREAAAHRLVREAGKARRAARGSGDNAPEGRVSQRHGRFVRTA